MNIYIILILIDFSTATDSAYPVNQGSKFTQSEEIVSVEKLSFHKKKPELDVEVPGLD